MFAPSSAATTGQQQAAAAFKKVVGGVSDRSFGSNDTDSTASMSEDGTAPEIPPPAGDGVGGGGGYGSEAMDYLRGLSAVDSAAVAAASAVSGSRSSGSSASAGSDDRSAHSEDTALADNLSPAARGAAEARRLRQQENERGGGERRPSPPMHRSTNSGREGGGSTGGARAEGRARGGAGRAVNRRRRQSLDETDIDGFFVENFVDPKSRGKRGDEGHGRGSKSKKQPGPSVLRRGGKGGGIGGPSQSDSSGAGGAAPTSILRGRPLNRREQYKRSKSAPNLSRRRVQWIDEASAGPQEPSKSVRWAEELTQETCIDQLKTCNMDGSSSSSLSYEVDDLLVGFPGVPRGGRMGSKDDMSITSEGSYSEFFGESTQTTSSSRDLVLAMADDMSVASSVASSITALGGDDDDSMMMLPNGRIVSKAQDPTRARTAVSNHDSMQTFSGVSPEELKRAFGAEANNAPPTGGKRPVAVDVVQAPAQEQTAPAPEPAPSPPDDEISVYTDSSVDTATADDLAMASLNLVGTLSMRVETEKARDVQPPPPAAPAPAAPPLVSTASAPAAAPVPSMAAPPLIAATSAPVVTPAPAPAPAPVGGLAAMVKAAKAGGGVTPSTSRDIAAVLRGTQARQQLLRAMTQENQQQDLPAAEEEVKAAAAAAQQQQQQPGDSGGPTPETQKQIMAAKARLEKSRSAPLVSTAPKPPVEPLPLRRQISPALRGAVGGGVATLEPAPSAAGAAPPPAPPESAAAAAANNPRQRIPLASSLPPKLANSSQPPKAGRHGRTMSATLLSGGGGGGSLPSSRRLNDSSARPLPPPPPDDPMDFDPFNVKNSSPAPKDVGDFPMLDGNFASFNDSDNNMSTMGLIDFHREENSSAKSSSDGSGSGSSGGGNKKNAGASRSFRFFRKGGGGGGGSSAGPSQQGGAERRGQFKKAGKSFSLAALGGGGGASKGRVALARQSSNELPCFDDDVPMLSSRNISGSSIEEEGGDGGNGRAGSCHERFQSQRAGGGRRTQSSRDMEPKFVPRGGNLNAAGRPTSETMNRTGPGPGPRPGGSSPSQSFRARPNTVTRPPATKLKRSSSFDGSISELALSAEDVMELRNEANTAGGGGKGGGGNGAQARPSRPRLRRRASLNDSADNTRVADFMGERAVRDVRDSSSSMPSMGADAKTRKPKPKGGGAWGKEFVVVQN